MSSEINFPRVTFTKNAVNLYPQHNPWLNAERLASGLGLELPSGREVIFMPTVDGLALKPVDGNGVVEWVDLPYGAVVEARLLEMPES